MARFATRIRSSRPCAGEEVRMSDDLLTVTADGFRWHMQPEFARRLGSDGIRFQAWLANGKATIVKQGPHRVVYRVALEQATFFVKHNLTPDRLTWLRQFIRLSKARREFASAQ